MAGWFFRQETVRTPIHNKPALLRGIRHDLGQNLAAEALVLLNEDEVDLVPLRRSPVNLESRTQPGNAATDNDDPLHAVSQKKFGVISPEFEAMLHDGFVTLEQ